MNCSNYNKQKGVTLIELIVTLSILVIVIGVVFSIFFFGNNTFTSGTNQFDIQNDIRISSDAIRNKIRYASELTVLDSFDPLTMDSNYNYIYLSSDDKSIIYKEGSNAAVNILDVGASDLILNLSFTKGVVTSDAIRFSNTIISASNERTLKYTLSSTDTSSGKNYDLTNEVSLMNVSFVGLAPNVLEGPTVTPAEGVVSAGTSVSLVAVSGADIYYTVDESEPTIDSTKYTSPLIINTNTTIKAIAVKGGLTSPVAIYYFYTTDPNPIASGIDVTLTGVPEVGKTMTVDFTYSSPIGKIQSGTVIKWYRDNSNSLTSNAGATWIKTTELNEANVTTRQYTLINSDKSKYIYVEIIPKDSDGNTGIPVFKLANTNKVKN